MSGLDAKVILLFTLLGTALAFRTPNMVEEDSLSPDLTEMEDDASELALQQDKAELMATYAKIAEEHAELLQFRHEVMKMGLTCEVCKTAAGYLLDYAKSDTSKNRVKDKITQKCNTLSYFFKSGCKWVVNSYFDQLWYYLSTNRKSNADYLCKRAKLC